MLNNIKLFNIVSLKPFRFKNEVKELCTIVEQVLNDAFSVACNVEDAINVLQSLHYFSGWPQLHLQFKHKTDEAYNMLIDEIAFAIRFYTGVSYRVPSFFTPYAGICITAMTEYKRITTLKNVSIILDKFVSLKILQMYCYINRKLSIKFIIMCL